MNRKKVDNRIRILIENGIQTKQRSMFFVVGNQCRNQVPILHHMLTKAQVKPKMSVLWCYKKELGFSTNRRNKMKQLQKSVKSGTLNLESDDPFSLFVVSTDVRYCYYNETHKILGNTYSMCILQDFEALTPNLLARTIETVEGSGIIIFLLRSMKSLRQLYTMTMDVHSRFRTESHNDVVGRFNERFLLSLASCSNCLVLNDDLQILPISSQVEQIKALPSKSSSDALTKSEKDLMDLKESLEGTQPAYSIVNCCKTYDQAKTLLNFIHVITQKSTWNHTVALTAARGRGKSAALGLSVATAIAYEYSNIYVTSPSPENLKTFFQFLLRGFDALEYQETLDYELVQSTNPDFNKSIVRVNVFRDHRQTVQYIHPTDASKLSNCELLVIDEAAAIPLTVVQQLLGNGDNTHRYLTFMSSTINGYEGTGRSLSLKLIKDLRSKSSSPNGRKLTELSLSESVRYAPGDPVEAWLNSLLCLDCVTSFDSYKAGFPAPEKCELFYVNRDTLFCYHKASERFLQTLMSLYVSSHYKNTPNDLQMLSDAPAHHIFCLVPPLSSQKSQLPEVLCVLQVCLEGRISEVSVKKSEGRGKRAAGDLIPWTISEQFQDVNFPQLCGARIVRIATHPDYQGMGYGKQAMKMLMKYFEGEMMDIDEDEEDHKIQADVQVADVDLMEEQLAPRTDLPPLLWKLSERRAEKLDYIGVSFGLTHQLFRFWQRLEFKPLYICQRPNELTSEHSCVMIRTFNNSPHQHYQQLYFQDFSRRLLGLLGFEFSNFKSSLALQILRSKPLTSSEQQAKQMTSSQLQMTFSARDLQRIEKYANDGCVYRLILDLLPQIARFYFTNRLAVKLMDGEKLVLLAIGLQRKSVSKIAEEVKWKDAEILAQLKRMMRKVSSFLNKCFEEGLAEDLGLSKDPHTIQLDPVDKDLEIELEEAAVEDQKRREEIGNLLTSSDLKQYEIGGNDNEWKKALSSGNKKMNIISVKSNKRPAVEENVKIEKKKTKKNSKKKTKKI